MVAERSSNCASSTASASTRAPAGWPTTSGPTGTSSAIASTLPIRARSSRHLRVVSGRCSETSSRHVERLVELSEQIRSTPVPADDKQLDTIAELVTSATGLAQRQPANTTRGDRYARRQVRTLGRTEGASRRQGQVDRRIRLLGRGGPRGAPPPRGRTRTAGERTPRAGEAASTPAAGCDHRSVRARHGHRTRPFGPARVPRPVGARTPVDHRTSVDPSTPPRAVRPRAARRVPGHRPDPTRDRRPAHRRPRRSGAGRRRARPSNIRGETFVHSPGGCSSSATRNSRSTGSAGPTSPSTCVRPTRSAPTTSTSRPTFARREP